SLKQKFLAPFAGTSNEDIRDGPRMSANFAQPSGLATSGTSLYVADSETSSIRSVSLAGGGQVRTLVGSGLFVWGDQDGTGAGRRCGCSTRSAWPITTANSMSPIATTAR